MLRLERHDREQDCERRIRSASSSVGQAAGVVVVLVAIVAKISVADTEDDDHVVDQAETAHECSVDEFVDDEFSGEDPGLQRVRLPDHSISGGVFHTQTNREWR